MGKPHIWGILVLFLAACTSAPLTEIGPEAAGPDVNESGPEALPGEPEEPAPDAKTPPTVELEDFGPAPELTNEVWLNAAGPLRLAELRGQVVLLDMWTFG